MNPNMPRKLKKLGMLLFLLGLLTGLVTMNFKNPRMALAAHLEGLMNGTFLIVAGLVWNELKISQTLQKITSYTLIFGTFSNWLVTLVAAYFATVKMTPIAGQGFNGSMLEENIVSAGFISVALTMIFSVVVFVYGLRGRINV